MLSKNGSLATCGRKTREHGATFFAVITVVFGIRLLPLLDICSLEAQKCSVSCAVMLAQPSGH